MKPLYPVLAVTFSNHHIFKEGDILLFNGLNMDSKFKDIPGIIGEPFNIKVTKEWFDHNRIILPAITPMILQVNKVYPRTWWRRLRTKLRLKTKLVECKIVKQTNSL